MVSSKIKIGKKDKKVLQRRLKKVKEVISNLSKKSSFVKIKELKLLSAYKKYLKQIVSGKLKVLSHKKLIKSFRD